MRRVISFLLGMIFGIVFLLSSVGIVAYVGIALVTPNDVYPESEPILGGLSDTTILQLVQDLANKYKAEASGVAPDGGYYTVGDFVADYNITVAMDLPEDVKNVPLLQYFTETDSEGHSGLDRAMKEIPVSAILSLVNFVQQGSSEDGQPLFDEAIIEELSNYTMYEMIMDENKGIGYVLSNVKLNQILPDTFPAEETENKLMWAVGETQIGKALDALQGDNNLFLQLSEEGALSALGNLRIVDIVGDDSPLLSSILVDTTIADLINENGEIVPDGLLANLELGAVLGLQKHQMENVDYTELNPNGSDGIHIVLYWGENWLMSADGGQTCFEAQKGLCPEEDNHYCGYDCFDYVWYETVACDNPTHVTDADHLYDGDIVVDGIYYEKASTLYNVVANLDLSLLTGGDSNALLDTFMNIPLGDLLGTETTDGLMNLVLSMTVNELVAGGYNAFTLGDLLQYNKNVVDIENYDFLFIEEPTRVYKHKTNDTYAVSDDAVTLYEARLDCTEEHQHTAKCFGIVWYNQQPCEDTHDHAGEALVGENYYAPASGIFTQLANFTIGDITTDANAVIDEIMNVKLGDLLGQQLEGPFASLSDLTIAQLMDGSAFESIYVGSILGYSRRTMDESAFATVVCENIKTDGAGYIKLVDGVWYLASLSCEEEHEHTENCYNAVWYSQCAEDCTTDHEHSTFDGMPSATALYVEATGIASLVADKTIAGLSDINRIIGQLTLRDVFGENVPSMLEAIADTPVDQLASAIDTLALGDILSMKKVGTTWYKACDATHDHLDCVQIDGSWYVLADGIVAKLADKTIADLSNLNDIISDLTIADVLGENVPSILSSLKDTPIDQLGTAIDGLQLGEMLGYTLESGVWYDCDTEHEHNSTCTKVDGIVAKLADKTITDLSNLDDIISDLTLADVLGDNVPSILSSLKDTPIDQLSTAIDGLKLGEMMGYTLEGGIWYDCDTEHTHGAGCALVTGMMAKLAGKTVADLGDLESTIQSFTLADVLGDSVPTMLNSIKDTPISDIGTAMDDLQLGEVMGYTLQNNVWYDCDTDHTHGAGCTVVDGINGALVDIKIGELGDSDTLQNAINTLTIADLGVGTGNAMLEAVSNVPLLEVGDAINELQMGVAMGYTLQGETWYNCAEDHTHTGECEVVNGVNAKIANLKVNEMGGGLNSVMTSLTVGDLLDSGMMTLEEDNQYKLDILFCNDSAHTTTVTVPFVATSTIACDLAGYFQWKNVNTTGTAKQFFEECHSGLTNEQIEAHRGQWKAYTLDSFVNGLLSAI